MQYRLPIGALLVALVLYSPCALPAWPGEEVLRPSTRIPFDPSADFVEQISNPALWKAIVEQFDALHRCVQSKQGTPAEPFAPSVDPFSFAARLGLDLENMEPADLVDKPIFWELMKNRHRELIYACGEPVSRALTMDYFGCRRACNLSWEACVSNCQSVGPPSPSCLSRCDRNEDWCSIVCAFY